MTREGKVRSDPAYGQNFVKSFQSRFRFAVGRLRPTEIAAVGFPSPSGHGWAWIGRRATARRWPGFLGPSATPGTNKPGVVP